jgi:hypothetical protein
MADTVESGVKLTLDSSDFDSKIQDILDRLGELESANPTVTVEADTSAADEALSALDGEDVTANVSVNTDESSGSTLEKIHALTDIGAHAYNMIINIAGTAVDFFNKISDIAITPLLDLDDAVARFNAHTAYALPNARELFSKILYSDLGTDIGQVEAVAEAAAQLNDPIEEATTAALTFTHVFDTQDPIQVLNALDAMVKTGLAPDFKTASDLLVVAFQNGADKGNDLLTVISQNAGAIKDLGLTGPEALQLITNELDNGAASAQLVIQSLETLKKNITAQTTTGKGAALDVLAALNIPNPITSGEGWTEEFFTSVADKIKNAPVSDAQKQQWVQALLGGKLGQKDYEAFLNMDAAQGTFDNLTGRAGQAAQTIDDSLRGSLADFTLAVQEKVNEFLTSAEVDLPGKITLLKQGIQDALTTLEAGGSLEEALTIGLKPLGFDDEFQKLESIFSNFIISLLDIIASLQDISSHGEAAKATRATITSMERQQLPFDLQITNQDEIGTVINTAIARGLTTSDIAPALTTAISSLISSGDFDRAQKLIDAAANLQEKPLFTIPEGASRETQAIANTAIAAYNAGQKTVDQMNTLAQAGIIIPIKPDLDTAGLQQQLDSAKLSITGGQDNTRTGGIGGAIGLGMASGLPATLDDLKTKSDDSAHSVVGLKDAANALTTDTLATTTAVNDQTTAIADQGAATVEVTDNTEDLAHKLYDAGVAAQATSDAAQEDTGSQQDLAHKLYDAGIAAQQASLAVMAMNSNLDQMAAKANSIAQTNMGQQQQSEVTPVAGPHASGGLFSGLALVGERGPELLYSDKTMGILNNRSARGLMQALSSAPFMGYGGGYSNKSVVINNINTISSPAYADALGYSTAKQIRGV